jgi:hypothetical protein
MALYKTAKTLQANGLHRQACGDGRFNHRSFICMIRANLGFDQ